MKHFLLDAFEKLRRWLGFEPPPIEEPPRQITFVAPAETQATAEPAAVADSAATAVPAIPAKPRVIFETRAEKIVDEDDAEADGLQQTGEFRFKDGVLDQLEHYMRFIRRMKLTDRCAYDLYSRIGIPLMPPKYAWAWDDVEAEHLPPLWLQTMPAFGGVAWGLDKETIADDLATDRCSPRFMYYSKYTNKGAPSALQPIGDVAGIYLCTLYYDEARSGTFKSGYPLQFALAIGKDGSITPLKFLTRYNIKLPRKNRHREPPQVPPSRMEWRWTRQILEMAAKNKESPEQWIRRTFALMTQAHQAHASSMIMVRATKDRLTATFAVDILRTPSFFKDRDPVIIGGIKKRIFHIVRPHTTESGVVRKLHFRGLREFVWGGYELSITVPGRDHIDWRGFNVAGIDEGKVTPGEDRKMLHEAQLAQRIVDWTQTPSTRH